MVGFVGIRLGRTLANLNQGMILQGSVLEALELRGCNLPCASLSQEACSILGYYQIIVSICKIFL